MKRIAVFPGSFDPVTKGHESLVLRALPLFDKIIVAIGVNAEKNAYFPLEQRIEWLKTIFANFPAVEIDHYSGLTVEYCKSHDAGYILRGLRTSADFEFERSVGQVNKKLYPSIENIFMLTLPEYTPINSGIVRDVKKNGGDIRIFVPEQIADSIQSWQ